MNTWLAAMVDMYTVVQEYIPEKLYYNVYGQCTQTYFLPMY